MAEHRQELTDLDQVIGDGDHGINMNRGFNAVGEKLPILADKSIAEILKSVGITLVSTVGGAAGPLYGTAFMRAGESAKNKEELSDQDVILAFDKGVEYTKTIIATKGRASYLGERSIGHQDPGAGATSMAYLFQAAKEAAQKPGK